MTGIEPMTSGFGDLRSILLSYKETSFILARRKLFLNFLILLANFLFIGFLIYIGGNMKIFALNNYNYKSYINFKSSFAQEERDIENQKRELDNETNKIKDEKRELNNELAQIKNQVRELDMDLQDIKNQKKELDNELSKIRKS